MIVNGITFNAPSLVIFKGTATPGYLSVFYGRNSKSRKPLCKPVPMKTNKMIDISGVSRVRVEMLPENESVNKFRIIAQGGKS